MPENNRKLRVFLCHASQDKPVVRELYQRLNAENWIDPWLDEEKLLPGQDWDMEIEKAVETADAVIVCLSSNSVSKEGYIQRELRFVLDIALEKPEGTIFVVPLRLDDCELPRRLRSWHYVDYFPVDQRDSAYGRLLQSLELRYKDLQSKGKNNGVATSVPAESSEEVKKASLPAYKPKDRPVISTPMKGTHAVNLGGTLPLIAYFLLASFVLFAPDDTTLNLLMGTAAILAGLFFLRRKQIPGTLLFKISVIAYLLLHVVGFLNDYYDWDIPYVEIPAGVVALVVSGILIASMRVSPKPVFYSSIAFASFLFFIAAKVLLNFLGYYPGDIYLPIMLAGVITVILLWNDI